MMKRELQIFFTALMFYTRIPCPKWVNHDPSFLNLSTRYFPVIGWLAGGVSWLVLSVSIFVFPVAISILLSMVASVLLTGAFHEDGFADVCDGFGGGWTKEKILLIMKDSRVGTYGLVGVILLLLLKFYALHDLIQSQHIYGVGLMLITAHTLSRFSAVCIIFTAVYSRDDADSKAKPVAQKLSSGNLLIAACWAVVPLTALCYLNSMYGLIIVPVILITAYLRRYFIQWIGGYTGDCLGATQQVNEVIIYLSLVALCRFS